MVESFTESDKVNQVGVGRELGDEEEHFAGRKLPGNPSKKKKKNVNRILKQKELKNYQKIIQKLIYIISLD